MLVPERGSLKESSLFKPGICTSIKSHIGLQFVQFAHEFSVVGSFTNDRNPRLRLEERANCSSDRFGVVSMRRRMGSTTT